MSQSYSPFGDAVFDKTVFGAPPNVFAFPPYEPFGEARFAQTVFGDPPTQVFNIPIRVSPIGYNALSLNWAPPAGTLGQTLVRSAYGTPTTVYDGTVLVSETQTATPSGPLSAYYLDSPLKPGQFYYYALFILVIV